MSEIDLGALRVSLGSFRASLRTDNPHSWAIGEALALVCEYGVQALRWEKTATGTCLCNAEAEQLELMMREMAAGRFWDEETGTYLRHFREEQDLG